VGDVVEISFTPSASTLVESTATPGAGEEKTPSMIPAQFHWSVLLAGTVVQCLDKDQRGKDAEFWQARYDAGLGKLKEFVELYGGDPASVWVQSNHGFLPYPDQRR
jgi:hypothetical protein